uniref:Uncharacterized protein n=1 Tax=uncultured Acetothermia bacterium TaxID=236499 RepID=H5SC87_9BACT|nr:hypothetical protein HGMM_F08F07C32 [uncultured Acetothermia bacterium]
MELGAVGQDQSRQIARRFGAQDLPGKPLAHQSGNEPAVIKMRMGQDHIIDLIGGEAKREPVAALDLLRTLKQPAVYENFEFVYLQEEARPCDRLGRAVKRQLHIKSLAPTAR